MNGGQQHFRGRHGAWSEGKGLEDLERVMTSLAALVPWDCIFCFLFLALLFDPNFLLSHMHITHTKC